MSVPLQHYPAGPIDASRLRQPTRPKPALSYSWLALGFAFCCLCVALSGFRSFRVRLIGREVHMYLLFMTPLLLYVIFRRLKDFPQDTLIGLVLFTAGFTGSTMLGLDSASEIIKIFAGSASLITAALCIRNEKDFRMCTLSVLAAVCILCFVGLVNKHDSTTGVRGIEGANENALSLYTLGPLMLAGYLVFDRGAPLWMRALAGGGSLLIVLTSFSSANRSGWLGVAVVGVLVIGAVMMRRGFQLRYILLCAVAIAASFGVVDRFADWHLLKMRGAETFTGHSSDNLRVRLFWAGIEIGLENPLLGVGPQAVPYALAKQLHINKDFVDAHNVYAYVMAATGLITTSVLCFVGWTLFKKPKRPAATRQAINANRVIPPHTLLRLMLLLWLVRGFFSREILYAPGFCISIGLIMGLCIVTGVWQDTPEQLAARRVAASSLAPRRA